MKVPKVKMRFCKRCKGLGFISVEGYFFCGIDLGGRITCPSCQGRGYK